MKFADLALILVLLKIIFVAAGYRVFICFGCIAMIMTTALLCAVGMMHSWQQNNMLKLI